MARTDLYASAGAPQPPCVVLGVLGRQLVIRGPHQGRLGVVEPGGAGGEHRLGEVLAAVVDVTQKPAVHVAVGLSGVGGKGDSGAWRAQPGQELGRGVAVAVRRVAAVGGLGSVDPSLGCSELSVTTCLERAFVCWDGRVDGDVLRLRGVRDHA